MLRLIFWIALIAGAIWLWRKVRHAHTSRPSTATSSTENATLMVRCACCDLHIPKAGALSANNHWYCSQPHLAQGPRAQ